jgi:hypothetical protein
MADVDIQITRQIQDAVAERAHVGFEDMQPLIERFVEQGYDEQQVREVVEAGLDELNRTYHNQGSYTDETL